MADNVAITAGSGTSIATDDCGAGGHTQLVKLAISTDGSATLAPVSSTDGVLVNLGSNNDVTVTSGTITLGAGTAGIGKLTANSGVDIGDVDVTSVVPGTGPTALGKAIDTAVGGTDTGVAALAVRDDALAALTPVDGDYVPLRTDANGALWVIPSGTVTVTGAGGSFPVTDSGGSLTVDGTVAATQSGTWNVGTVTTVTTVSTVTNVVHVDDNAGSLTVDGTVTANLSATDNAVLDTIDTSTAAAATSLAILDDWDNAASDGASVSGDTAHGAADAGEPVKIGANATASLAGETVVDAGDRTDLYAGVDGVLITRPYANLEDSVSGNASNTDGTSTQVIASSGAGVRTYITTAILTNTSASNIYVELKDGTTVMATIPVPATGGCVVSFPVPLRGTAATAWNYDPSAAATTTYCTLVGFKSKV